jgi:hypothetical protein
MSGYKTYIIAALLVGVALVKLLSGDMDIEAFLNSPDLVYLLSGLGLAALRAGVAKTQ